jgi:ribosomal-protein-alanine N-acetyltransferase
MTVQIISETRRGFETLRITEMLSSDIPAVAAIEQHSNLEPWTQESFLEELLRPHSSLMVARVSAGAGESVAGYICFWLVADEVQILNFAVHEAYRRLGIGRALLLHCLDCGVEKRSRIAVLEVRSSNLAAQHLYTSLGFRVVGQRPDYYGSLKEPAVLMQLTMARQPLVGGHETCCHKRRPEKTLIFMH